MIDAVTTVTLSSMNGTHYFEAFRFLTNEVPIEVSAWFDSVLWQILAGPNFRIHLVYSSHNGLCKRLYVDASGNQGHGVQVTYMSRNGRITIDELTGRMTTVVRQPEHREAPTSRYGMPSKLKSTKSNPWSLLIPRKQS